MLFLSFYQYLAFNNQYPTFLTFLHPTWLIVGTEKTTPAIAEIIINVAGS